LIVGFAAVAGKLVSSNSNWEFSKWGASFRGHRRSGTAG
jgi:hypothetical protein